MRMNLEPQHALRYFEARLKGQRWGTGAEVKARCPFHDDRNPSLSVNFEKGVWTCHAGCGNGGILEFEEKFSHCDRDTAKANVAELVGEPVFQGKGEQPEAVYQYRDAQGRVVFEKLRYPARDSFSVAQLRKAAMTTSWALSGNPYIGCLNYL